MSKYTYLLGLFVWVAAAGGVGAAPGLPAAAAEVQVPAFSGERAFGWLTYQCDLGPRPPGSKSLQTLRDAIMTHADSLGFSAHTLCFAHPDPYGGGELEICNLVVSAGPPGGRRLWLGAHYDTRPYCDQDPDPARRAEPLLGANDGGSGVAVLLHLLELFAAQAPQRGVDILFFDGEDYGRAGDLEQYCIGSRKLAATWRDFGSPLATGQPTGLILLDMVGECDLDIPQEAYSLQAAPAWTAAVFDRADGLGLTAFRPERGPGLIDDHVPFLSRGIPAVDLIDFDFPAWHTTADTPAVCCPQSLAAVGTLIADISYRPLDLEAVTQR